MEEMFSLLKHKEQLEKFIVGQIFQAKESVGIQV